MKKRAVVLSFVLACAAVVLLRVAPGLAVDATEVLTQLQAFDAVYEAAFTCSGTQVDPPKGGFPNKPQHPAIPRRWKLTMSNGQCALVHEAIEIPKFNYVEEKKDELIGVGIKRTLFFGSEFSASHTVTAPVRATPDGPDEVMESHHDVDFYPSGDLSLGLPKREILWSLGRGFSKEINEMTSASEQSDGSILCTGMTPTTMCAKSRVALARTTNSMFAALFGKWIQGSATGTIARARLLKARHFPRTAVFPRPGRM